MCDVRVSGSIMERLGYGRRSPTYTLKQMIVGAILSDMADRDMLDLGHFDAEMTQEMGKEWEDLVRRTMAGDGNVNMTPKAGA